MVPRRMQTNQISKVFRSMLRAWVFGAFVLNAVWALNNMRKETSHVHGHRFAHLFPYLCAHIAVTGFMCRHHA